MLTCMAQSENGNTNGGRAPTIDDLKLDCDVRVCGFATLVFRQKLFQAQQVCQALICVRTTNTDRSTITQAQKPTCNDYTRPCATTELCVTGCSPAPQCEPSVCIDPVGEPIKLEEALYRADATVELDPQSRIVMTLVDGARTEFRVSGQGRVSGANDSFVPGRIYRSGVWLT